MNKQYECELLNDNSKCFLNSFCLPYSEKIYNSFPYTKKSFEFYCDLIQTNVQINQNYLVFSENYKEDMVKFLENKLKIKKSPNIKSFSFIKLKGLGLKIDFFNEKTISGFLFQRKCYGEYEKIDLIVWKKKFQYVLYGNYFIFFKDISELCYINLDNGLKKTLKLDVHIKPLNFCEYQGNYNENVFLIVFHENLKKYGLLEISLYPNESKILKNIIIPNNVINCMEISFFTKNFDFIIFSHDFLFPHDKSLKNMKRWLFFLMQKYEFALIFRILIYDQENKNFIEYFNFELTMSKNDILSNLSIYSLNNNLFCKFYENNMVFLRDSLALEELEEKNLIEKLFIENNQIDNKKFIKRLFSFTLIKSLNNYKNYEDLSFHTKNIVSKILSSHKLNDNFISHFLRYLIDTSPKKIFYLIKYFCLINDEENMVKDEKWSSRNEKKIYKIWKLLDFYKQNNFFDKTSCSENSIIIDNFGEYNEILKYFDDYEYTWIYLALKTNNFDFINDMIIFNKKFEGICTQYLQKLLILCSYERKKLKNI